MNHARITLLLIASLTACVTSTPPPEAGAPAAEPRPAGPGNETSGTDGLRTSEAISKALEQAQAAFMDGNWGVVVVQATRVIEGAAEPDDYYLAVKLLGMASCNRKDPRPVVFSFKRLSPGDRETLISACKENGLTISSDGAVTKAP